jgi:outer membrane lipoprotein LolB
MPRCWRQLSIAALLSLLTACASQPQPPLEQRSWQQHRQAISEQTDWQFSGKVLVKTSAGADSASMSWRQSGADLHIEVAGPAGFKQVQLIRQGQQMRIFRDGEWQTMPATDVALEQLTGWPLPLDLLPWWVRGIPAPTVKPMTFELADERLASLQQAGWSIDYTGYQQVDDLLLPAGLRFSAAGVEGKILFKRWQLAP